MHNHYINVSIPVRKTVLCSISSTKFPKPAKALQTPCSEQLGLSIEDISGIMKQLQCHMTVPNYNSVTESIKLNIVISIGELGRNIRWPWPNRPNDRSTDTPLLHDRPTDRHNHDIHVDALHFYSAPIGERSTVTSVSIRDHSFGTAHPTFIDFLFMSPMAVARSSAGGVCYVFRVLQMTSFCNKVRLLDVAARLMQWFGLV